MNAPYTWAPPICFKGDRVLARPHKGAPREALVCGVETNYGWADNAAWHSYSLKFDGAKRRHEHHAGEDILQVLPTPCNKQEG